MEFIFDGVDVIDCDMVVLGDGRVIDDDVAFNDGDEMGVSLSTSLLDILDLCLTLLDDLDFFLRMEVFDVCSFLFFSFVFDFVLILGCGSES